MELIVQGFVRFRGGAAEHHLLLDGRIIRKGFFRRNNFAAEYKISPSPLFIKKCECRKCVERFFGSQNIPLL